MGQIVKSLYVVVLSLIALGAITTANAAPSAKIKKLRLTDDGEVLLSWELKKAKRGNSVLLLEVQRADGQEGQFVDSPELAVQSPGKKGRLYDASVGTGLFRYRVRAVTAAGVSRWSAAKRIDLQEEDLPDSDNPERTPREAAPSPEPLPVGMQECPQSFVNDVIGIVNQLRAANGLATLSLASSLNRVARSHSIRMARDRVLSHDGFAEEMDAAQLPFRRAGQNVAVGFPTPQSAVNAWMNSAGHRANILKPDYSLTGVGCVIGAGPITFPNTTYWWTQDFIGN